MRIAIRARNSFSSTQAKLYGCGKGPIKNDYDNDPKVDSNQAPYISKQFTCTGDSRYAVRTVLRIEDCSSTQPPVEFTEPRRLALGNNANNFSLIHDNGEKSSYYMSQDTIVQWIKNPFNSSDTNKMLYFDGSEYELAIDTSRGVGNACIMGGLFSSVDASNSKYTVYDSDTFYSSNKRTNGFYWNYYKKYRYIGAVETKYPNTKIRFMLPDAPYGHVTHMIEERGLPYQYDTTNKIITITFSSVGVHKFHIVPENPCVVDCYFPNEITNHFEFDTGELEVLGHEMPIKQSGGWLDMSKGSKMLICEDAVCRNRDSLTLIGGHYTHLGTPDGMGYVQNYLNNEGYPYRESFGVGSGIQNDLYTNQRTMIIVEEDGGLELTDSSFTQIGSGTSILVKAGGTLKIKNGAHVVIGDESGGFGEIIIEDSAFLCIEPFAKIEFYNDLLDTTDRHVFFVSQNPDNPAIVGVSPSSLVSSSVNCITFCDLASTFPTHGIENEGHGWVNVGKPDAWMQMDRYTCSPSDIVIEGHPTLNETRYQFFVTKYDTATSSTIGTTDTIPQNQLDSFYGGRIGWLHLGDSAALLFGNTYKITLNAENDCGDTSRTSKLVYILSPPQAQIEGDTVVCPGDSAIVVHGLNSIGEFNTLSWETYEYIPLPYELDSASYIDSYFVYTDTLPNDSVIIDTFYYSTSDTNSMDTNGYDFYFKGLFDTTFTTSTADTFKFPEYRFKPGRKYAVVLKLSNACSESYDTLFVRTHDGPSVNAGPDKFISATHSSVTNIDPELEGSASGYVGSPSWSPTTNLTPSSSLTPVANPSSTVQYVLSATDAIGCTNTDTATVFVNSFNNSGADTIICFDDSAKVGIPSVSGYSYEWSPSVYVSDSTIAEPYVYPNQYDDSTVIRLKVTNNSSDVEWDEIVIYRDTTIDPTYNQMGGVPYDVLFTISETQVVNENFTWVWGDGWSNGTGNNPGHTYPPAPSSSYYTCVSYVNACGTVEWCDTVKFDALGNHIPTPPSPNSSKVEAAIDEYSFNVAPNPFQKQTSITYQLGGSFKDAQIEIFGIDGKRIQKMPIQAKQGRVNLNMENYESGMYYAKLVVDGSVQQVKKLILNH